MLKQFIFVLLIFLVSCGRKEVDIPSFAVKPLEASSINSFPAQRFSPAAERISCDPELDYWNASPQLVGGAANSGAQFVESFYGQANFYDCNARQQALEDSGELEIAEDSPTTTTLIVGDIPEDFTRFVSWSGNSQSSNGAGKLVNLYLQDNGIRTKTRIDFSKEGGVKTVNSILIATGGLDNSWSRALFKEVRDGSGDISEHYVGGRHYDDRDNAITIVVGHLKKNVGSATFKYQCTSITSANFNNSCTTGPTGGYLDDVGGASSAGALAALGVDTSADSIINALGTDLRSNFYTGSEVDYFEPVFRP